MIKIKLTLVNDFMLALNFNSRWVNDLTLALNINSRWVNDLTLALNFNSVNDCEY
jgi:hypothetical protein